MVPFRLMLSAIVAPGATKPDDAEVLMAEHEVETEALTSDELLVEEVSIDGMCGVY